MNRFKQIHLSVILCALLVYMSVASSNQAARAGMRQSATALVKGAPISILVNAKGMTLYLYTPDKKNQSTCTGQCAAFWPPLVLAKGAKAPASIPGIKGAFGVANRAGGARQITFNGEPLYTFVKDKKPGDMAGQGLDATWWVVALPPETGALAPTAATNPVKAAPAQQLVTSRGLSLYTFAEDKKNQSNCTGKCAAAWPPLTASAPTGAVPGFSGALALASASGGRKQLTYNGSPLYTFVKDKKSGDLTGQGVGGVWWIVVAPAASTTASLLKTSAAQILVTAQGMTLYLFTPDKPNQSTCTGQCAQFWPPLVLAAGVQAPSSVAGIKGVFATAPLAGGSQQLTFDGAPLYTFVKDVKPGDMNGQGAEGTWWTVAAPAAQTTASAETSAPVKTATIQILVTTAGLTLYIFTPDKKNQSACTGACAKFWPPLVLGAGTTAAATVPGVTGVFGVAPLAGGNRQVTYAGSPLYTFANDKKPGDMNGQGTGGKWWIAAPAGQSTSALGEPAPLLSATPSATGTATSTSTAVPAAPGVPSSTATTVVVPSSTPTTAPSPTPIVMPVAQPSPTSYYTYQ